jgi:glycosyltransferase involved in cell wall biosynthesis
VVLYHVLRTRLTLPTPRHALAYPEAAALTSPTAPRLCIIIPAHNEAGAIAPLARSLKAQTYGAMSAVFCLDRCTDDTSGVLRSQLADDPRFHILAITDCPPDWAGKVHAIWRGVSDAPAAQAADLLLFIDADTSLHPDALRAAVALLTRRSLGMLSLLSTMTHGRWFENVVQPAAGMELMRQYPLLRANLDAGRRPFANGQFILMTRAAYQTIGGHQAARAALLEDVEIARLCHRHNVRAGMFIADGLHACRMYADYAEFVRGWKRIYTECANRRVDRLRKLALRTRLVGAVLPALTLAGLLLAAGLTLAVPAAAPATPWPAVLLIAASTALALMLAALALAYRMGHTPLLSIPAYPVGAWLTGGILAQAARDLSLNRPTIWGGREYTRQAR